MVVLVDGFTASASEITAGAIQDYDRGTLIGTRTFGKALVQSIVSMPEGAVLKLTTAVYLTPNGRDINERGIKPDVKVKDKPKQKGDEQLDAALDYIAEQDR
jgi:carboxyl-terminal processing protease